MTLEQGSPDLTNNPPAPLLRRVLPNKRWQRIVVFATAPVVGFGLIVFALDLGKLAMQGKYFYLNQLLRSGTICWTLILMGGVLLFGAIVAITSEIRRVLGRRARIWFTTGITLVTLFGALVYGITLLFLLLILPRGVHMNHSENGEKTLEMHRSTMFYTDYFYLTTTNGWWYTGLSESVEI